MRPSTRTGLLVALFAVMFVAAIVLVVRKQAPAQENTARPAKQSAPPAQ